MFWTRGNCSGPSNVQVTACSASFRNPARQRLLTLDWLWGTGGSGNGSHGGSQDEHLPATPVDVGVSYVLPSRVFQGSQLCQATWLSPLFKSRFWEWRFPTTWSCVPVQLRVLSSHSFEGGFETCSAAGSSQALGSHYA